MEGQNTQSEVLKIRAEESEVQSENTDKEAAVLPEYKRDTPDNPEIAIRTIPRRNLTGKSKKTNAVGFYAVKEQPKKGLQLEFYYQPQGEIYYRDGRGYIYVRRKELIKWMNEMEKKYGAEDWQNHITKADRTQLTLPTDEYLNYLRKNGELDESIKDLTNEEIQEMRMKDNISPEHRGLKALLELIRSKASNVIKNCSDKELEHAVYDTGMVVFIFTQLQIVTMKEIYYLIRCKTLDEIITMKKNWYHDFITKGIKLAKKNIDMERKKGNKTKADWEKLNLYDEQNGEGAQLNNTIDEPIGNTFNLTIERRVEAGTSQITPVPV